jgi:hypothetical protein
LEYGAGEEEGAEDVGVEIEGGVVGGFVEEELGRVALEESAEERVWY